MPYSCGNDDKISYVCACMFCRHLSRRHKDVYDEYTNSCSRSSVNGQMSVASFLMPVEQRMYSSLNPRQKLLTSSLVSNVIVKCGLPISVVDNVNFRKLMAVIDPKFYVPCRQTVAYSMLPQMKKEKQDQLQRLLESASDLALTTDIWTDRRLHAFLAVTVHILDYGKPRSHLLAFKSFQGS